MDTERNHAVENARGHLEAIRAAYDALALCKGDLAGRNLASDSKALLREHGYDGSNSDAVANAIRDAMREAPLSVEVRSLWHVPGGQSEPGEYCILLSTGGPALRLMGELSEYGEPESVTLEHQDWGTPWTPYDTTASDDEALLWFAQLFWYGS